MNTDSKKNILIVDDDPFLQTLYRKTLEREGFNILTAVDGQDAVEMLPSICADLVVLDLMLPKVHGLKVLETIRADSHHKDLPVLILSNAYLPETAQKAMQAKATVGMLKSECSPKQLIKIIRETLKQSEVVAAKANGEADKTSSSRGSWFSGLLGNKAESNGNAKTAAVESVGTATSKTGGAEPAASSLEVQSELLKSWPTDIAMLREIGLKYVKTVGTQESEEHLKNLYRRLRLLGARATIGELSGISQLSNALEAMLFEHGFNIKRSMSPSVLQTMVQAVDCLEYLFKSGRTAGRQSSRRNRILLVDDDPVCNMANDLALKRANFETMCVGDGPAALTMLQNKDFDLILLDVNMPGLNGFEVCKKIRQLPLYLEVPVIFVTINDDFQSRAQSVLSGSNGLITKPISPLELIVKSLVFLLRGQEKNAVAEMSVNGQSGAGNKVVTGDQTKKPLVEPPKTDGRVKELKATQAAVEDRVKALTQALAAETKRREEAEQQAAANAKLQAKLETAKVDNQNAHEHFERMLEESKLQAQNSEGKEAWKLEGRNRALESVRNFVQDKVRNLSDVLEAQTKKSEAAKQQAAEYAKRKLELEKALAEIQQAKNNLMREIEAAGNGKLRGELEAALAANMKSQESLLQKIEKNRQEFQNRQPDQVTKNAPSAEQKPDPASAAQVKALTAALAAEKKRCEAAEQQAAEISQRRSVLEAELVKSNREQDQLRNALAEQQQRLAAQVETQNVELKNVADRTKELEAAQAALAELKAQHAGVAGQVQSLTEKLAAESGRRTTVEQQSAELLARRAELEQELAQRTQAQEQLRAELAEKQRLLDAQVQTHQSELGNLSQRTKELEGDRVAVEDKVKALTEALAAAKKRCEIAEQQAGGIDQERGELAAELAQSRQMQEQLRAQLAEQQQRLDAQVQTHNVELGNFSERVRELEAAQVALAELKARHSGATEQVAALTESLAVESNRRTTAEQTAAELAARRAELEQELAKRTQTQEQLRAELSKQQQQLDTQVQTHKVELGNFNERLQELDATQAALANLKDQHKNVAEQARGLTESLKSESDRRAAAEQNAAELAARRNELEQELAQRTQAQEQLRAELSAQQQRLDAQVQTHHVELENFGARVKELESTKAAMTELEARHAEAAGQVRSLTETLASESGRRESAEKQSAKLAARRTELEQELARRTQSQEELHNELSAQQKRLETAVAAHNLEVKKFEARVQELAVAQTALTELQAQHSGVTEQVQALNKSLTTESGRREDAEKQVAKLIAQRIEMEHDIARRTQAQKQLRAELASQQQRLDTEVQAHAAEQGKLAERTKELEAAQTTLTELKSQHTGVIRQVEALTESLKSETDRRASAEKQSAELAARRTELEQELGRRTQTQEQLHAELAEKQKQLETQVQAHNVELGNLAERTKELEVARAALAELKSQHAQVTGQVEELTGQVRTLTESLKSETSQRESAEKQSVELAARRTELEQELARRTQTQEQLRVELAEKQKQLEAQVQAHSAEQGKVTERTQELEAAHAALAELKSQHAGVTQQVQSLTESLKSETNQRESAEKQSAELATRRAELEQELVQRTQAQEQLRVELAEKQKQLAARVQAHNVEQNNLTERTKELEVARTALAELKSQHAQVTGQVEALTGQVRTLTESLKSETSQRESAEKQSAELASRRTELEQELARRTQTQEQLQTDLTQKQQRIDAVVAELEAARNLAGAEALRQQQMAGQMAQSEQARAELDQQLNVARELSATRETAIRSLELELQKRRAEQQRLDGLLQAEVAQRTRLETQIETIQVQLDEASSHLAKKCADEQVWLGRESELQGRIRNQQDELAKSGVTLTRQETEIQHARVKLEEFEMQRSALIGKVQSLTGQSQTLAESLAAESGRRATVEQQAAELLARRTELEQQLAGSAQALAQLRAELAERVQAHNIELGRLAERTKELEVSQAALAELKAQHADVVGQSQTLAASLATETGRREVAEKNLAELIVRRTELEQEVASRAQAQEQLRVQLAKQVQAHTVEVANLAARTQELEVSQMALADLKRQHAEVSASLTAETNRRAEAERVWLGRESELQGRIGNQQAELAKSNLNLAGRELEIKDARKKIEELQVLQSALCAKVQDLIKLGEANAKTIQNLKTQVVYSDNTVKNSEQKLAGLRYAILDASRMNLRLHRERLHKERQNQEAMRRLLSSLAQTPLSLAQRGMIAELQHSVDGLKNSRTGALNTTIYPVELPGLRGSEFDFMEMVESAFQAVRAAATAAGVTAQVSVSGAIPHRLIGCAEHVHQLITLLAVSPLTITTGVNALDLRVAIKPKCVRFAEITLRAALACDGDARELLAHLTSVTTAASLQTGTLNEAEIGLAAGWQLAEALGSQAVLEMDGDGEVCIALSLPVEMDLQPEPANEAAVYRPSLNGHVNGNGHHDRNGQQTSDNNGYHLTEARAGVAD